jgi:hypothetical protein
LPIYGISGSGHQISAARAAYEVAAVSRRTSTRASSPAPVARDAAEVRISEGAELLAKLRVLHDERPKEFKRVVGELAGEARELAERATSDKGALRSVAERLTQAATDGNLTPLVPAIASQSRGRAQYGQPLDGMLSPNEGLRELFRGFVAKVQAVTPANQASSGNARR